VADTRLPPGPFGGPALQGQTSRDFAIPESACSIPSTAAAYSLNVAVVPHGGLGYLTVWPAGQLRPVIATLNSVDGRIKANAAIIPAGSGEAISVYATQTTDVVLDIDGYFVPATGATLAFFPLTPCRVADTRWTTGPLGGPYLSGAMERVFPVLSSSCNIPDTAQAYSLNFAAIPHGPLGYMTVWPTGESKPLVSTLNALTGTITANAAIVPSGLSGAISVYPSSATDLVIDIDGYFAPADSAPGPLSLFALTPCRVLDTRQTTGAFSGTLPVSVLPSGCQVPSAQAYVLNATVVPQNGQPLGYLTLWPDAEDKPVVSTLNALDGAITSNMAIVSTLNGFIDAYATTPTDLVVDIFSYFAPIAPLSITTTSLPSATLNYNYNTTLGATGGVTPYAWSITSGSLPPGLNLDPTSGLISGTPTMTGTYPFTVQVSDSQSPPATAAVQLSITVNATLTQLSIVTTSLPSGAQNQTYSAMLAATGGLTPYAWSVTAGSLPRGLSLNSNTGAITGAPTGGGISSFTVQAADAESPPSTASAQLSITITVVPLRITTASLPSGVFGTAYSAMLTATGGVYPYTWSITAGSLPAGLSLNGSTGAITGTPTGGGASIFTVQVADSESPPQTATAQLSISIAHGIFLTGVTPNTFFCVPSYLCLSTPVLTYDGTGIAGGEIFDCTGYPPGFPLPPGVGSTQFQVLINIGWPYYRPRFIGCWLTSADGTLNSNVVSFASTGDQPIAADAKDFIFALNQGGGVTNKYNRSDGSLVATFSADGLGAIVVERNPDGTTKYVVDSEGQGLGWLDPDGHHIGGAAGDGAYVVGVAANGDVAATLEPSVGKLVAAPMVAGSSTPQFFTVGGQPEALAMSSCTGENDAYIFDAQGLQLSKLFIASNGVATLRGSVSLPEFTAASNFNAGQLVYGVNWYAVMLPSCNLAVYAPVKNGDGSISFKLAIVNANTMTETIPGGVSLPANTFRVYADEVNGNFIVASSDASGSQGVNHFAKVDPSGTLTPLSSTSPILAVGGGVSLDGNSLYVTGWDPLDDGAGLQVKFVPNN
jgi:hypothetical protein